MSDLTERLAAKLVGWTMNAISRGRYGAYVEVASAQTWLPLLLSEPELVAGLAPEVKREVLRTLLGERLEEMAAEYSPCGDVPMIGATNQVDELLDHLAPERAP